MRHCYLITSTIITKYVKSTDQLALNLFIYFRQLTRRIYNIFFTSTPITPGFWGLATNNSSNWINWKRPFVFHLSLHLILEISDPFLYYATFPRHSNIFYMCILTLSLVVEYQVTNTDLYVNALWSQICCISHSLCLRCWITEVRWIQSTLTTGLKFHCHLDFLRPFPIKPPAQHRPSLVPPIFQ